MNLKQIPYLLSLFSLGLCFQLRAEVLTVPVDGQTTLELPARARRVDISSSEILKVDHDRNKSTLFLTGKKEGSGQLKIELLGDKMLTYSVSVVSKLDRIEKEFSEIPGLKTRRDGNKVTLSGRIESKEDLQRVRQLKKKYLGLVLDATGQGVSSSHSVTSTINRILTQNDMQNIQANAYGRIIALEGSAKDKAQGLLAMRIAAMIYPSVENRLSDVTNGGPSISIEVLFVEVVKDNDASFGFQQVRGPVAKDSPTPLAAINMNPITGTLSQKHGVTWQVGGLSQFLNLIQTTSRSRVLSNPKLIARSGVEAEFKSGETIYLSQVSNVNGQAVNQYLPIDAGVILKITPKIDDLGQIDASIDTEVSEFSEVTDGPPTKSISNIATAVTIRDGQTVLLSGLINKRNSKSVSRIPIIADIPLVGELFKNRDLRSNQIETMILVTMNRVEAEETQKSSSAAKLWEESDADISLSFFD